MRAIAFEVAIVGFWLLSKCPEWTDFIVLGKMAALYSCDVKLVKMVCTTHVEPLLRTRSLYRGQGMLYIAYKWSSESRIMDDTCDAHASEHAHCACTSLSGQMLIKLSN